MSEEKSHFRMKKGDIEIEYEGKSSEANARYKEAFEWIKAVTISPPKPPKEGLGKRKEKEKKPHFMQHHHVQ